MLIYGSYAIQHWFKDYYKDPTDIDIAIYDKKLYNQNLIDELNNIIIFYRNSLRIILPVVVIGNSSTNLIIRGYSCAANFNFT